MNMMHVLLLVFCLSLVTGVAARNKVSKRGWFASADKKTWQEHAQTQWEQKSAVHCVQVTPGAKPDFIVVFVHGFLGFRPFDAYDSWNEVAHKIVPALHGRNYVVYHPGLLQTKDVQSFAQGTDIDQVAFHVKKVITEIEKDADESSVGGYSVSGLPLVLVGHSNGASTLISWLSQHHSVAQHVKGVVLLAPYADLREASTLAHVSQVSSTVAGFGVKLFYAPRYSPTETTPAEYVQKGLFPVDLPTLVVSNVNDRVVPFKNRNIFAQAFARHPKYKDSVVFLDLQTGGHNWGWRQVRLTCEYCKDGTAHSHGKFDQRRASKVRKHKYYLRSEDRDALKNVLNDFLDQKVL